MNYLFISLDYLPITFKKSFSKKFHVESLFACDMNCCPSWLLSFDFAYVVFFRQAALFRVIELNKSLFLLNDPRFGDLGVLPKFKVMKECTMFSFTTSIYIYIFCI